MVQMNASMDAFIDLGTVFQINESIHGSIHLHHGLCWNSCDKSILKVLDGTWVKFTENCGESAWVEVAIGINESSDIKIFNHGDQSSVIHTIQSCIESIDGIDESSIVGNINRIIQGLDGLEHTRSLVYHSLSDLLIDW